MSFHIIEAREKERVWKEDRECVHDFTGHDKVATERSIMKNYYFGFFS